MNDRIGVLVDLLKEHVQIIDQYAEIVILEGSASGQNDEFEIYILTPNNVDYGLEQQYSSASIKVGLISHIELKVHVHSKEDWHKLFVDKAIYQKVNAEGLVL